VLGPQWRCRPKRRGDSALYPWCSARPTRRQILPDGHHLPHRDRQLPQRLRQRYPRHGRLIATCISSRRHFKTSPSTSPGLSPAPAARESPCELTLESGRNPRATRSRRTSSCLRLSRLKRTYFCHPTRGARRPRAGGSGMPQLRCLRPSPDGREGHVRWEGARAGNELTRDGSGKWAPASETPGMCARP